MASAGGRQRALGAARRRCSWAAPTKSRNSGWGRVGRDRSSGWNWPATKNGWSGSSIDLGEAARLRRCRTAPCPWRVEQLVVGGVHLPAMAMAFLDDRPAVGLGRPRARHEVAGLGAQPHGRAQVGHVLLLGQQVDHRVRRRRVELARVRALEPADVAGELDHRALQTQADPRGTARRARERSAPPRPCPRPRGRRSRRGSGCRRRRASASSVAWPPRSSEATQSDLDVGAVVEPAVVQRLHHARGRRRAGSRTCRRPRS